MATRSMSAVGLKSAGDSSRATKSAVFGQTSAGGDKAKKKLPGIPMFETPKQLQRRILKLYERNCAADGCKILSSLKKTLREGIQQDSLQARFFIHAIEEPLTELEAILKENTSTKISIIPFINALRQTRYVHIRLLHIWSIVLDSDELVSLALLLDKGSYLLKHIELIDCLIEPGPLQRLSQSLNTCRTLTSLILDYNKELYLDGNTLECEGAVELIRLLVRQAGIESEERRMESQRAAMEAAQAMELERHKKLNYSYNDPEGDAPGQPQIGEKQQKKKKRRKRKSKKKPPPPPPPVGPWIHKLHLADNGIDALGRYDRTQSSKSPENQKAVALLDCLQMFAQLIRCSKCLQELDLHDNLITEVGGFIVARALMDRAEGDLPNIKLRTTHRISSEALTTIVAMGSGLQKKRRRKPAKKK